MVKEILFDGWQSFTKTIRFAIERCNIISFSLEKKISTTAVA